MTSTQSRTEAAPQNERHKSSLITPKASVESPAKSWVSNRSTKEGSQDQVQYLKESISFTRLLKADGHHLESSGRSKRCLCPIHPEQTASFHVYEESGRAKCYGCGWSGDIIEYVRDTHGLGFGEALEYLTQDFHNIGRSQSVCLRKAKARVEQEIGLTQAEQDLLKKAAKRLSENPYICESVASKRGWNPATIKALAEEGSLGWDGALAFLYPKGMKSRNWPGREFFWDFGSPGVWRGNQIGDAMEIFICEGETDCIALLDKGIEEDGTMAVIALPSASTIPSDLPNLVQGRHVTLCMDDDTAGARATEKLADLLVNVCASVQTFNFKEVAL